MKHLLQDAKQEIESLRRRNEILSAKVEVMDLFATVLHTTPNYGNQAMSVDVAWELGKQIAKLDEEDKLSHLQDLIKTKAQESSGEPSCEKTTPQ